MISEEKFCSLKPGDRVRIVRKWDPHGRCSQNSEGQMDCWLGKVMTIKAVSSLFSKMEEDSHENRYGWSWNRYCIDEIIRDVPVGLEELI